MKKIGKKLFLNKKTIDLLDDKSLQNVKGGADIIGTRWYGEDSCYFFSCDPNVESNDCPTTTLECC